ncbi:glycosyltransferase family 4 protein, partial [Candidatus Pacearchaeota archaeon]|nr:glycosyltransferase family 4 protein [Candidatus Pacearchaeota archaeon]
MKLCIVSTFFHPSIGGIERYLKDLTEKLIEQNIEVHVVTASFDGGEKIEKKGSMTLYRTPFLNPFDEKIEENSKKFLNFMEDIINKNKIDLISAQNFHRVGRIPSLTLALNLASMNLSKPLTLRIHSFSTKELDDCFLRDMSWDKIICVSNSVKEDAYSKGVKIDRLITVYPGVDTNKFRPDSSLSMRKELKVSDDEILILWAGRICNSQKPILDEKGLLTLLKAFSVITPRYKKIK